MVMYLAVLAILLHYNCLQGKLSKAYGAALSFSYKKKTLKTFYSHLPDEAGIESASIGSSFSYFDKYTNNLAAFA